jgi:drug/metabolite transporter (DMT)-like permease
VVSSHSRPSRADLLLLHAVVLIWGLTAVLGKGIDLPATILVAWRTGLAAVGLYLWLRLKGRPLWPGRRAVCKMMAVGGLIGFHWFLFFLSGKLGPVSIALIGISTCSLWCALLEPLFIKGKRLHGLELWLALGIVAGAVVIGFGHPVAWPCLLTGVAAALVAALFSFSNNRIVQGQDPLVMTLYEMIGACLLMTVVSLPQTAARWVPSGVEWLWMVLLSQVCTVWAFSVYIGLLRRLSVYFVSMISNLEPVWGILLAWALLGEYNELNGKFWIGAAIVLVCVAAYPILKRRQN